MRVQCKDSPIASPAYLGLNACPSKVPFHQAYHFNLLHLKATKRGESKRKEQRKGHTGMQHIISPNTLLCGTIVALDSSNP